MAMSAASMKTKIEAAIQAATGQAPDESAANQLLALCTGIIGEITANATVAAGIAVATSGGPSNQTGQTTAPGKIS